MSGPPGPRADSAVINAVAYLLAESTDWSGDELGVIADLIGTVRPHPGEVEPDTNPERRAVLLAAYRQQLHAHTPTNPKEPHHVRSPEPRPGNHYRPGCPGSTRRR